MTIEVGKWYRTRNGQKAFVGGIKPGAKKFYGYVEVVEYDDTTACWTESGRNGPELDCPWDLVAPWSNKPILDWSKEREWVKAVAMDGSGSWFRYASIPHTDSKQWLPGGTTIDVNFAQRLHPTEYPTNPDGSPWTGDWKESLIVRPEGGWK